ncbi:MAG: MotA/TolQ/ExbB proton channel family protein [Gammaproteobacteria bacterium]
MNATLERASFLLDAGGIVLIILLILSVIALAIILLKFWQFRQLRLNDQGFIQHTLDYWRAGQANAAMVELYRTFHPAARVMEVAIRSIAERRVGESTIREEVTREGVEQVEELRSHLRSLEVIASISPLLGLLGTVMGMINAFQQMEIAGTQVSPSILSGGVWEALLTTAVGLAIAIPVVVVLNWFERQVEKAKHTMEDTVTRIFTIQMTALPEEEKE